MELALLVELTIRKNRQKINFQINMEIKEILTNWLKSSPKWVKIVTTLLIAAIAAIYLCTSCSTISRVQLDKRTTREVRDTTHLILSSTVKERTTYKRVGISDPVVTRVESALRSDASDFLTVKAKP